MATIDISNIGPVAKLSIPCPEHGGVVVLKGRNGSGKSHSLASTEALLRGSGSLDTRDGQLRGDVAGFGARIAVARATRRSGELDCVSLEGRLNVADLVDPGMKDPAAADSKRIKALVSLAGVKAAPELFHAMAGGRGAFEAAITPEAIATDDLVEMAARVKRAFEAAARKAESDAEKAQGQAAGLRSSAGTIDDMDELAKADPQELQRRLEVEINAEATLRSRAIEAENTLRRARDAQARLTATEDLYAGPTVAESAERLQTSSREYLDALKAVESARESLRYAEAALAEHKLLRDAAEDADAAARGHCETLAALRAIIDDTHRVTPISEAELQSQACKVTACRQQIEQAAIARKAAAQLAEAQQWAAEAAKHRDRAEHLRDAAHLTDDVLSAAVASDALRVESGRLVTTTPRGATYFADLSHGERWRIALDLAAARVGEGGLIVVPQEAWEGLDPANREAVAGHAQRLGVVILTAEADAGELRAEVYGDER